MKTKSLEQIIKEVDALTDNLNEPVDEDIKPLVVALRFRGFETTASCAGHLDRPGTYPWVDIDFNDKRQNKVHKKCLKKLLKEFNKNRSTPHPLLLQDFAAFRLQNMKWPRTRRARRQGTDKSLGKALLNDYRREMADFAAFLLK